MQNMYVELRGGLYGSVHPGMFVQGPVGEQQRSVPCVAEGRKMAEMLLGYCRCEETQNATCRYKSS